MKKMDNDDRISFNCSNCGMKLDAGIYFCPSCGVERGTNQIAYRKVSEMTPRELTLVALGGLLILGGLMPFFMMDTSVTGVTGMVRLSLSAGILSALFGFGVILFGAVVPRVRNFLT